MLDGMLAEVEVTRNGILVAVPTVEGSGENKLSPQVLYPKSQQIRELLTHNQEKGRIQRLPLSQQPTEKP